MSNQHAAPHAKTVLRLFSSSFPRSLSRTWIRGLSRTPIREQESIGRKGP
jgi:hypothetical protein